MDSQTFSIGKEIRFGWDTAKSNIGFFIVIMIAMLFLLNIVPTILYVFAGESIPAQIFIFIISLLLNVIVSLGFFNIALRFCDNEKAEFADLFNIYPLFFKYLISSILLGLIVVVWWTLSFIAVLLLKSVIVVLVSVVLFIPIVICIYKLQFFGYFIIDNEAGPLEALKRSFEITKGAVWNLILFWCILVFINMLGMLALLIGLFVTIPLSLIAHASVYRTLAGQQKPQTKPKIPRLLDKPFDPNVDIYTMTEEEFIRRLQNE